MSTCEQPQSLPRTQEHPVIFGRRGPRSTQTPLDQEDPGVLRHPWTKNGSRYFLGSRSTQTPLEEESHPRTKEHPDTIGQRGPKNTQTQWTKRTQEHPDTIGGRVIS
ncbi:hypothetical protein STEG23_027717 [Scotinomys teguina]